jgi:hypothetical protein
LLDFIAQSLDAMKPLVLRFQTELPDADVTSIGSQLIEEIHRQFKIDAQHTASNDVLSPLRALPQEAGCSPLLIVHSIDGTPYHLLRPFLFEVAELAKARKVTAVISGEHSLSDLVALDDNLIPSFAIYMLQGFDRAEFEDLVKVYLDRTQSLGFDFTSDVSSMLWEQTGGNDSLVTSIFWSLLQQTFQQPLNTSIAPRIKVAGQDIQLTAQSIAKRGTQGALLFLRADELISREPQCWNDLETLRDNGEVVIGSNSKIGPLEFSGLAIRTGERLTPASVMASIFLQTRYSSRRMADFRGQLGQWEEAFDRYGKIPTHPPRPLDVIDRRETAANVAAFRSYILSASSEVPQLFATLASGCKYLLGFSEIMFWERRQEEDRWLFHSLSSLVEDQASVSTLEAVLPADTESVCGPVTVPERFSNCLFLWRLSSDGDERQTIVAVSDLLSEKRRIAPVRFALLKELLTDFHAAHSKALQIQHEQSHNAARKQFAKTVTTLLDKLGEMPTTKDLVQVATNGLRALRYKRVFVSLVDSERLNIKGIYDDSDESQVKIDKLTDWPLAAAKRDLQPWVVHHKTAVRIRNAELEPLANQTVIKLAEIKALAIVPILVKSGIETTCIGTVHFERFDKTLASKWELDMVQDFAGTFGIMIDLAQRLRLLTTAFDHLREPVAVFDGTLHLWRKNAAFTNQYPVTSDAQLENDFRESVRGAMAGVKRTLYLGGDPESALSAKFVGHLGTIRTGRREPEFTLLQLRSVQKLYATLMELDRFLNARDLEETLVAVLMAGQTIGRKWGRAFRLSNADENKLQLFHSYSALEEGSPDQRGIKLASRSIAGTETWQSIDQGRTLIFEYDPNGINGSEKLLPTRLSATTVTKVHCPAELGKKPGDYWLDVPIVKENKSPFGKLTFEWSELAPPSDFAVLSLLGRYVSRLASSIFSG